MSASDAEQCRAITQRGDRCSHSAQEDGFCYLHDEDDETVDETDETDAEENDGEEAIGENGGEQAAEESDGETGAAEEGASDGRQDQEATMSSDNSNVDTSEIGQIRDQVHDVAEDVVGHPLDGILAIDREDESWRVAVEVIERSSVPDTQDILGRYEITLDDDRTVTGYRRTHRYRRDDMEQDI